MNREQWLNTFVEHVRPWFADISFPLPEQVHASCGWPTHKAASRRGRVIGQCFTAACSHAGVNELFISPAISDSVEVGATLVHELIHAADNNKHGHKGAFVKAMKAIGLTGKPTATIAGPELTARLNILVSDIGQYPHSTLDFSSIKKQSTRLIKLTCPECGYVIRTTAKWIEESMPVCRNDHEGTEFEASE